MQMEKEESCGQKVLFTYLQEQISPHRWVLREEGKFILTVHRNRYGKKCGFAEGKMLLGWSVHMNSVHEPRKRKQAQSYRTREVYPTGTSPSTPSRPQRSQSSSTVAMTRSTSPRWKLNWSGPAAVWSQRARTALEEVKKQHEGTKCPRSQASPSYGRLPLLIQPTFTRLQKRYESPIDMSTLGPWPSRTTNPLLRYSFENCTPSRCFKLHICKQVGLPDSGREHPLPICT